MNIKNKQRAIFDSQILSRKRTKKMSFIITKLQERKIDVDLEMLMGEIKLDNIIAKQAIKFLL